MRNQIDVGLGSRELMIFEEALCIKLGHPLKLPGNVNACSSSQWHSKCGWKRRSSSSAGIDAQSVLNSCCQYCSALILEGVPALLLTVPLLLKI